MAHCALCVVAPHAGFNSKALNRSAVRDEPEDRGESASEVESETVLTRSTKRKADIRGRDEMKGTCAHAHGCTPPICAWESTNYTHRGRGGHIHEAKTHGVTRGCCPGLKAEQIAPKWEEGEDGVIPEIAVQIGGEETICKRSNARERKVACPYRARAFTSLGGGLGSAPAWLKSEKKKTDLPRVRGE
ncbi:hypothetical protein DFH09DRAFT_1087505 [Mycena vulgaris]|nr:hypothetical protein DFH09DRAFT_1087505 [Mycena vulgaris]